MPTATSCIYKGKLISIDEAIEIRNIIKGTHKKGLFKCTECDMPVKPMKSGGHTSAHFEHFSRNTNCSLSHGFTNNKDSNELRVKLTDGAIGNGYIKIPSSQKIFESNFIAEDEQDSDVTLLTLTDDQSKEIETYVLKNRGRLAQRFYSYFKSRNIKSGTVVKFTKIDFGKYSMEFNLDTKSIKELYEEYKNNPRTNWINRYKERCDDVNYHLARDITDVDDDFYRNIWLKPSNGVASAKPGVMSNAEYEKLYSDLNGITAMIAHDPSPDIYDEVVKWAKESRDFGKFKTVKWGVINRVFAVFDPNKYTTILNENKVLDLILVLNKKYALKIATNGNWAELNIGLTQEIRNQGLQDEDVYLVNTFIWELYMSEVEGKSKENEPIHHDLTEFSIEPISCKNIIYYGPPGTGKTYQLQKLLKENYTDTETVLDTSLWLNKELEELSWHEIIILILLDLGEAIKVADIISHEYYKIKAVLNERTGNLRATAWAALQSHTVSESETVKFSNRIEPLVFNKTKDSKWFIVDNQNEQVEEYVKILDVLNAGPKQTDTVKRYEFVTFHQSYGYEEFIEGLRPKTTEQGDISYEIKPGVFKRICKLAEADPENQYAMVIDEINRGNISKIFGELITLVEVDKRAGEENELTVTLPYSGLPFSVPSNIDIIGTMNTADRSLTHIDVALRRRFDFKELRTDYSLISDDVDGINLRWMLYAINQRIELLLDREHILGHALLMNINSLASLSHAFKSNIMPLLEEYFFESWNKINQVLNNNDFVEELKEAASIWLGDTDDYAAKSFRINLSALNKIENYKTIYSDVNESAFDDCEMDTE